MNTLVTRKLDTVKECEVTLKVLFGEDHVCIEKSFLPSLYSVDGVVACVTLSVKDARALLRILETNLQ